MKLVWGPSRRLTAKANESASHNFISLLKQKNKKTEKQKTRAYAGWVLCLVLELELKK